MKQLAALLGLVWALLNLALALLFLMSSVTAKTAQKEGILAQLALLFGGLLVGAFAALLARQSLRLFSGSAS